MPYNCAAASLQELGIGHVAVAMAIVDGPPDGVAETSIPAVSSCAFWRQAESATFFAPAAAQQGCAVGAHVMGFPLSAEAGEELGRAVALMSSVGYLPGGEVAHIPQVRKAGAGAVYGPLASFPLEPDCVLVWVTPAQAMLLGEALQTTAWTGAAPEVPTLLGRPACSALASALNTGRGALSLGCTGMRTFTEAAPTLALFVIPGAALATLPDALARIAASNQAMLEYYQAKRDALT